MVKSMMTFLCALALFLLSVPVSADEMFYVQQCRVLDTRNLSSTPIANGSEFSFKVRGQVGQLQGGTTDCGIPVIASGVVLSIASTGSLGNGHLEVYPYSKRPPIPTSRLNYTAGTTIANELVVFLNQPINTLVDDITILPSTSPTHVVADVVGYLAEPNPTFAMLYGRTFGTPFAVGDFLHIKVETVPGNDCLDPATCFEIECSNQPGARNVCAVTTNDTCVEVQGYRRPYSSHYQPNQRMVGTVLRLFGYAPCPWE